MHPKVQFLERNGVFYKFDEPSISNNSMIQWFIAKGSELYPNLDRLFLSTLARTWYHQTVMKVDYQHLDDQTKKILETITADLYVQTVHPMVHHTTTD